MTLSVLALPVRVARVGGKLAKRLAVPMLAVTLVRRVMQRSSSGAPSETRFAPEPAPAAKQRPVAETAHEPAPVVDPVPLAEPAVDLDADVLLASALPIRSFDALAEADAVQVIHELTDVEDVRTVLRFEEQNAKRSAVLTAAQTHLAALSVRA